MQSGRIDHHASRWSAAWKAPIWISSKEKEVWAMAEVDPLNYKSEIMFSKFMADWVIETPLK